MRQLRNDLAGNVCMPLGRDENAEAGRGKQRCDKLPVPGSGPRALAVEPVAAGRVKWRINVGCVDEYVGVDREHYRLP